MYPQFNRKDLVTKLIEKGIKPLLLAEKTDSEIYKIYRNEQVSNRKMVV